MKAQEVRNESLLSQVIFRGRQGAGTMLAKKNLIWDATDLSQDSFVLSKLYDYDIILLDHTVPDIEGYKLSQQLRPGRVAHQY